MARWRCAALRRRCARRWSSPFASKSEIARRLVNQAVFLAIVAADPDNVQAQRTPLYERSRV